MSGGGGGSSPMKWGGGGWQHGQAPSQTLPVGGGWQMQNAQMNGGGGGAVPEPMTPLQPRPGGAVPEPLTPIQQPPAGGGGGGSWQQGNGKGQMYPNQPGSIYGIGGGIQNALRGFNFGGPQFGQNGGMLGK